eukprot:c6446_g1_i1.p1 GENE.c6446_g1_i1~~c6446_g1_i1.p1  ORF type:complete len:363 (+),score=58.54 c6446_g1_i1:65-1153(+)
MTYKRADLKSRTLALEILSPLFLFTAYIIIHAIVLRKTTSISSVSYSFEDPPNGIPKRNCSWGHRFNLHHGDWVDLGLPQPYEPSERGREICSTHLPRMEWIPHGCNLEPFSKIRFCEVFRDKRIAFVGDSLTNQMVKSLFQLLQEPKPTYNVTYSICNGTTDVAIFRSPTLGMFGPDSGLKILESFDVFVVSGGPHFHGTKRNETIRGSPETCKTNYFSGRITKLVEAFSQPAMANKTLIWRTNPPGISVKGSIMGPNNCRDDTMARPTLYNLPWVPHVYNWDCFLEFDQIAWNAISKVIRRSILLNVTPQTLLRPEFRVGWWYDNWQAKPDCLHYCLPGAPDLWNQMLMNLFAVMPSNFT